MTAVRRLELELAVGILIVATALTGRRGLQWVCKQADQRNGGAICEHPQSKPLAPPKPASASGL